MIESDVCKRTDECDQVSMDGETRVAKVVERSKRECVVDARLCLSKVRCWKGKVALYTRASREYRSGRMDGVGGVVVRTEMVWVKRMERVVKGRVSEEEEEESSTRRREVRDSPKGKHRGSSSSNYCRSKGFPLFSAHSSSLPPFSQKQLISDRRPWWLCLPLMIMPRTHPIPLFSME